MTRDRSWGFALMTCVLAMTGAAACGTRNPPKVSPAVPPSFSGIEMIGELKDFAEAMGSQPTDNFRTTSARVVSDERCYFTGKLQLLKVISYTY